MVGRAGRPRGVFWRMHARAAGRGLRHHAPDLRRRHAEHRRLPGALRRRPACRSTTPPRWATTRSAPACCSAGRPRAWAPDLVRRLPGRLPGLYLIEVDERGERRFSYWRDQAAARAYFDTRRHAAGARSGSHRRAVLQRHQPGHPAAGRARAAAGAGARLRERGAHGGLRQQLPAAAVARAACAARECLRRHGWPRWPDDAGRRAGAVGRARCRPSAAHAGAAVCRGGGQARRQPTLVRVAGSRSSPCPPSACRGGGHHRRRRFLCRRLPGGAPGRRPRG
jgi:hypothetical protein